MRNKNTCTLRLPQSLKEAVKRLSRADGTSIDQFVATAVAEKVSAFKRRASSRREGARGFQSARQD